MAVVSVPAMAASDDDIAKEIIFVYQVMCVKGIGKPATFLETLGKLEASKTIMPVPEAQTKGLFKKSGKAWTTKTPSGVKLLVTHDKIGVCGVRVEESDEDALKDALQLQIRNIAKEVKGEVVTVVEDQKKANDRTFSYYEVKTKDAPLAMGFGISTTPEKKKAFQHLLTFNLAKPEAEKK